MPRIRLLQTRDSALSASLLERFAAACASSGPDSVALLLPSGRAAREARRVLALESPGALFDPRVMTFPQLAEALLIANHHPFRRLSPVHRHALVAALLRAPQVSGPGALLESLAERPGVVSATLDLLDDLKHAAVHPTEFRARIADRLPEHPANTTVATLYSAYQRRLQFLGLYDDPGLFWEAVAMVRDGRLRPLEHLRLLLLDGFTDFTTTQLQLLEALSPGLDELTFSMPLDPARPALSARAEVTRRRLEARFPALETMPAEPPSAPPASTREAVAAHLFAGAEAELAAADESLRILEVAGGVPVEAREIARQVKQLITRPGDPVPPGEVAIALVAPGSGYEAALRQSLAHFGIPAEFSEGPPLATVPAVRAVLDILDVLRRDWSRADVVKLLNSSYVDATAVSPAFPGTGAVESTALVAGVMGGLADWRKCLRSHARELARERRQRQQAESEARLATPEGEATLLESAGDVRLRSLPLLGYLQAQCEAVQATLSGLHALLAPLSRAGTWPTAVRALGGVISALRLVELTREGVCSETEVAADLAGLKALAGALSELAEAPGLLGLPDTVTLSQFCDQVARLCRETRLDAGPLDGAGVQVLPATVARQLRFRHLFIPGLVDGLFPARGRQDPFYPDEDRERLARTPPESRATGVTPRSGVTGPVASPDPSAPPLERRLGLRNDQAGLFHDLLRAASETVWLSYPGTSTDGSPLLRSAFVDEVEHQFARGAAPLQRRRLSQVLPRADEAATPRELAEAAFSAGLPAASDESWLLLRRLDTALAEHALAAACAERDRRSLAPPGRYQGVLAAPDIRAALSGPLLGPEHIFSPSRLGTYAQCPMRFLFGAIFRLEALEEPSPDQQAADLGALAHRILALALADRQAGRDAHGPLTLDDRDALLAALESAAQVACTDFERTSRMGHAGLWRLARARLEEDLRAAIEADLALAQELPRAIYRLEYPYGRGGSFSLDTTAGPVRIAGRIDRVDVLAAEGTPQFVVFDYKSGAAAGLADLRQGLDLQLPLYSLAGRAIEMPGGPPEPKRWVYFRIRRPVACKPQFDKDLPELEALAIEHIGRFVNAMRQGFFAVTPSPKACRYCDFAAICRRRRQATNAAAGVSA